MFRLARSLFVVAIICLLCDCTNERIQTVSGQHSGIPIVPGSDCDLCATVGDTIYFDFASCKLRRDAQATLAKQADWLIRHPKVRIMIAGDCDDRGTDEYNLALGFRRANADREFLVAKGVASDRVSVVSNGKEHPIAIGDNEQAWARNRNAITSIQ
jgi:peptidoglycan-associated lipoprotein